MPTVRRSVIVPHSCETMFHLVEHCEDYPQFLPWCAAVHIPERTPEITRARLDINYHGLKTHIATLNRKEPPNHLTLEFVEGPFEHFHGDWRFIALGDEGCHVELAVEYTFSHHSFEAVLKPVFGHIVETLVDRFVERADRLAALRQA
ncbi:MAG TPA: type II toxin-antitoxin system RatA family toxin [Usitatibacter sp.]|nr:type II toxin-antitoxin system RatA family toxin [Usitatibacter sp.]